MKPSTKRLLALFASVAIAGVVSAAFTLTVRYKPYGVPDSQRDRYEKTIADLASRGQLIKGLADQAKPVAMVKSRIHDFGMLGPHTTTSHAFVISNDGELPLTLDIQETSCKCTVGKLAEGIVMPGEATEVTLTWNTGYQADHYEQTATLRTNDPLQTSISLVVRGEIRAECIAPQAIGFPNSDAGKLAETEFLIFSQLWDDFTVRDVRSDLESFQWSLEPAFLDDPGLIDTEAKSAWRIKISTVRAQVGPFAGDLNVTVVPTDGGDAVTRTVSATGKVRAPIGFYSPEIHKSDGLDIGTLVSGKEHLFHLVVRARDAQHRKLQVLDVQPEQLAATLEPLSQSGSYRLTVRVPANCPRVTFNLPSQHGYVQVGDPDDKDFSNWFPLHGVVVDLPRPNQRLSIVAAR